MIAKLLLSFGVFCYALVVPVLELNSTHLLDPAWPAHARLHEAWQLATNSALGVYALWLIWRANQPRLASLLGAFVTAGFLLAYALRASYGGSMVLSDGSEKTVAGINLGVFAFTLAILLSVLALRLTRPAGERP